MINWDAIGAIAELVGAIAVVTTIGYLAVQIRQTNKAAESDTLNELHNKFNELNALLLNNSELHALLTKKDALSDFEKERVYTFANMQANIWINVQNAYDNGQINRTLFDGMSNDVSFTVERFPNIRPFFDDWLNAYPEVKHFEIFSGLHK